MEYSTGRYYRATMNIDLLVPPGASHLCNEQLERGKSNLRDIAVRIKMLTNNDFKENFSENDNGDSSSNSNGSNDFEKYLDNKDKSKRHRLNEETEPNRNRKVTPVAKFNQKFMKALKNI
ncbi:hypothetical protein CBL_05229 [Carabus blaptoides fortunei]